MFGVVVEPAADVAEECPLGRFLCIQEVCVNHEVVHGKVLIWVVDTLTEVWCRHDPSIACPGIRYLLVPAISVKIASPVMVSKHTDPRDALKSSTIVYLLKNAIELVLRNRTDAVHW